MRFHPLSGVTWCFCSPMTPFSLTVEVCQTRLESQGTVDFIEKDAEHKKNGANWAMNQKRAPWLFRVCRDNYPVMIRIRIWPWSWSILYKQPVFVFPKVRPFFLRCSNCFLGGSWLIHLDLFKRQICSMALYISVFVSTGMMEKTHLCYVMICVLTWKFITTTGWNILNK